MSFVKLIFILLLTIKTTYGNKPTFKFILERSVIKYKDALFIGETNSSVVKANRSSPYVLNLDVTLIGSWAFNVSFELKTYELRNNQYRESIIRAEVDLCFAVAHDQWLMPSIRKYSNLPAKCPVQSGSFRLNNFILPEESFPSNFPEGKWRFDFKFFTTSTRKYILKVQIFFKVESLLVRKAGKKKKS